MDEWMDGWMMATIREIDKQAACCYYVQRASDFVIYNNNQSKVLRLVRDLDPSLTVFCLLPASRHEERLVEVGERRQEKATNERAN